MQFHENPPVASRLVPRGQIDLKELTFAPL